jgi:hypothetical protein
MAHGNRCRRAIVGGAITAVAMLLTSVSAGASSATATITAGSLGFINSTPGAVSFSTTLNGLDRTLATTLAMDVSDATGSGAGWNITATSTTFTYVAVPPRTLTGTVTVPGAPTDACDAGSTCSLASNAITYPYSLPSGTVAPTATKLFNAAAASGMGNQLVTPTFDLPIPATTYAGTSTSTWTISLVSGP